MALVNYLFLSYIKGSYGPCEIKDFMNLVKRISHLFCLFRFPSLQFRRQGLMLETLIHMMKLKLILTITY